MYLLTSDSPSTLGDWKAFTSAQLRTYSQEFVANGATTVFAITGHGGTFDAITAVYFDGLLQKSGTHYTVSTNQITTADTLPNNTEITIFCTYLA